MSIEIFAEKNIVNSNLDNITDDIIRKVIIEKNISIDVLSCALNISDEKMENILSSPNILDSLDCMQYGEFLRVLDL